MTMKQLKNQLSKTGEQETEQMVSTTIQEQDCNRIQVLQNHIQNAINDLSGQ